MIYKEDDCELDLESSKQNVDVLDQVRRDQREGDRTDAAERKSADTQSSKNQRPEDQQSGHCTGAFVHKLNRPAFC